MSLQIDKRIRTEADFNEMSWHDATIYRMQLSSDLVFDIDYITKWNQPDLEGMHFTFWITPSTLVFHSVRNLELDIDVATESAFEIDYIERLDAGWTVATQRGEIQFDADSYTQYFRQNPFFEFGQQIPYIDRNGYSLERTTDQENPNRNRDDVLQRRKKDQEDYEISKARHLKQRELNLLAEAREKQAVDTKEYLRKKRELSELIVSYNHFLKGTRFEHW